MSAAGPVQPEQFVLDIVKILTGLGIPYAVVGALAVSYYGVPRSTADADMVIWLRGPETEEELKERLMAVNYSVKSRRGDPGDPISRCIVVEDEFENRMDLLAGIHGMDPAAIERRTFTSLMNSPLEMIGAEDLVAMKLFAGGLQDLEDARGILQVSGRLLNLDLLRSIANRYGPDVVVTLEELLGTGS